MADGAVHRAAYFGGKLAQGLGFKGDLGRCRGWVDRTARLLDEANIDCVEQGYLQWGLGMLRIFEAGDMAGAHAHFVHAGKIGARFAHRDLVTVGPDRRGPHADLPRRHRRRDGAARRGHGGDRSRRAVTARAGDAYCTVIDACAELFDLGRCRAWTDSFVRWCDTQQELVLYRGHCFLHRAEVLELLGAWPEALVEARHACDRLAAPVNPAALAGACAIEGDLLRLVGDFDGAEAAYLRASEYGHDPQPGLALLRLAQGQNDAADAMIRRALDEAQDPMSRARLLGPYVEIVLATGDTTAAARRRRGAPSSGGRTRHPTPASARRSRRAALCSERRATRRLRSSSCAERSTSSRRSACATTPPELVCSSPRHVRLSATSTPRQWSRPAARGVLDSLAPTDGPASLEGLTQRELEILRLLASGKTNRVIAQELVISEKTVASHVSHIFTKLGVTSRSAATAYAYDHDLVG